MKRFSHTSHILLISFEILFFVFNKQGKTEFSFFNYSNVAHKEKKLTNMKPALIITFFLFLHDDRMNKIMWYDG